MAASVNITGWLRSLASGEHPVPITVPQTVTHKFLFTISVNTFPCANDSCAGRNGSRLAASVNNISFTSPSIDILQAYYNRMKGVYGDQFPSKPPLKFNYTAEYLPLALETPRNGTLVKVLEYNATVEMVLQGTNVVGWGFGNFHKKDPKRYNLMDPPLQNIIAVPKSGWAAVRFQAFNPERHLTRGMEMAFIVKNSPNLESQIFPPPSDTSPC